MADFLAGPFHGFLFASASYGDPGATDYAHPKDFWPANSITAELGDLSLKPRTPWTAKARLALLIPRYQ